MSTLELDRGGRAIVGGLLAVVNFLQLEQGSLPHVWHVAIGAASVFLGTLLVTGKGEAEQSFQPPETAIKADPAPPA